MTDTTISQNIDLSSSDTLYRISGSQSGAYEEFYLLEYNDL
jgi:hypothetical protein